MEQGRPAHGQHRRPADRAGEGAGAALGAALDGAGASPACSRAPCRARPRPRRLAGFGDAEPRDELREWDYGAYEGRKTAEIREERPGWTLWADGVPNGETAAEVAARVDAVLADLRTVEGAALVFAHGHLLRVLAARWIGLEPEAGRLLALDPATVGVLGYERETPVIRVWNAPIAS